MPMTRYLEILAVQRPLDVGPDQNARSCFSCNFTATAAAPVTAFEHEVAKLLSDAGLGTLGTDLFVGSAAVPPTGTGPYVQIINTGGAPPAETHDDKRYERLAFQIFVRAGGSSGYTTARTRALAIWRELDGTRDVTVAA
jgi:hypothetical protein